MTLKDDAFIDQYALDFELVQQPTLVEKYSDYYADACFEKDKAKERLKEVEAEIDLDVRRNWKDKYKFDVKPTEPAIKSQIILTKEYKKASRTLMEATRTVNRMKGASTAMEHKKASLGKLTELHGRNYFAEPRIDKEAKQNMLVQGEKAHQALLADDSTLQRLKQRKTKRGQK